MTTTSCRETSKPGKPGTPSRAVEQLSAECFPESESYSALECTALGREHRTSTDRPRDAPDRPHDTNRMNGRTPSASVAWLVAATREVHDSQPGKRSTGVRQNSITPPAIPHWGVGCSSWSSSVA
jgi:hypothetical protein